MSRSVRFALFAWALLVLGLAGRVDAQSTWTGTDIGQVAIAGSSTVSGTRITISAEGTDIWNSADSCYFVYRPLTANGEVTARVSSLTAVSGWTKGGVMIRQSLAANSMMAALLATPSNGLAFEQRRAAGVAAVNTPIGGVAAPVWLRLSRSGTTIAAYRSTNGTAWTYIARADIAFAGTVYVGFAVSSNGASQLATGTFDSPALSTTVSAVAPSAPLAAYAFDEGTGTTARDSYGTNHAALNGATWTTGRTSRGLAFNGVDQSASVPDAAALDLTANATMEAWVRPTTVAGARSVVTKESPTGLAYQLQASGNSGRPSATFNVGATDLPVTSPSGLPLNTWSHVAVTLSGTAARLYVNGTQVASRTVSGTLVQTSNVLRIGGAATFGDWFAGTLDDLRIYNRALSQVELTTDRNNPVRPSSSGGGSDTSAPSVSVTAPTSGASVSGTVTLSASATDNVAVTRVQFSVNGTNVGSADTTAPYGASWNTTGLASGTYAITAIASDAAGNATTSAAVNVTIGDAAAPTVTVTAPTAGATVSGTVTLSASASDNVGVTSVQFRVNGTNVGTADTTSPYAGTWSTTGLTAGTYTITAVATDAAGNQGTSAGVAVTIAGGGGTTVNARSVSFDSPSHNTNNSSGQPTVTSYRLEVWAAGSTTTTGTPLYTSDMGKPASSTTALTIDQTTFFSGLPRNQQFIATVSAIGSGGSARSDASNVFTMQ